MARRSSHNRLKAEINIVPYIDVMLVLLVIFMVTAPLLNQGVEVDLPKAKTPELIDAAGQESQALVLSMQKDGTSCYLNVGSEKPQKVDCGNFDPRREELKERLNQKPQPLVLIRAARELRYEQVMKAMAALTELAPVKLGLSTAPPDELPVQH